MTRTGILFEQNWESAPTGLVRVTNNYASALIDHSDLAVVGVHGRHKRDPTLPLPVGMSTVEIPLSGRVLSEGWKRKQKPNLDRWVDADIIHAPNYVLPATNKPLIATIHNVALLRHPEWFTPTGVSVFLRFFKRIVDENLSVIVPSEATADDLAFRGVSERRIHVIPWGVDVEPADVSDIERVRATYELPDEFVLFVGTLEPRKNLRTLATAMERFPELPLLVAGPTDWGDSLVSNARMLGRLPDEDVGPLMAAATMLAYPSHLAGFGLPVLEAMAQGTPVVTTQHTAPAEILAGAGFAVDTRSPNAIANAIGQLASSPKDREQMGHLGRERVAEYRWEATAQRAQRIYTMLS